MGSCEIKFKSEPSDLNSIQESQPNNDVSLIGSQKGSIHTDLQKKTANDTYYQEQNNQTESIAGEYSILDNDFLPQFVLDKTINETLKPRNNRFIDDLEMEVKLRIQEMYVLIYKYLKSQMEEEREIQEYIRKQKQEADSILQSKKQVGKQTDNKRIEHEISSKVECIAVDNVSGVNSCDQMSSQMQDRDDFQKSNQENVLPVQSSLKKQFLEAQQGNLKVSSLDSLKASRGSSVSIGDSPKYAVRVEFINEMHSQNKIEQVQKRGRQLNIQQEYFNPKGILKYNTSSVSQQNLKQRSYSSKTNKTSLSRKKVTFSQDTKFSLKKEKASQKILKFKWEW